MRSWSPGTPGPSSSTRSGARRDEDPTEPFHSKDYPFTPVPDEPAIAKVRERLKSVGLHPASLPLGVDIDRWLARAKTPFDAYPDTLTGKMDAESCGLAAALKDPDIDLQTGADVIRLETDEAEPHRRRSSIARRARRSGCRPSS